MVRECRLWMVCISIANMSGESTGRVPDLSCRFFMTHEVRYGEHSMTDSVRVRSCLSCLRNCLSTRSKVDS